MVSVQLHKLIDKQLLTSRTSVIEVVPRLVEALSGQDLPLVIDLDGFEGVSPSVIDQLLLALESLLGASETPLILDNVPVDLTRKYQSVAAAHNGVWLAEGNTWTFQRAIRT